jgi:hypothetical protein
VSSAGTWEMARCCTAPTPNLTLPLGRATCAARAIHDAQLELLPGLRHAQHHRVHERRGTRRHPQHEHSTAWASEPVSVRMDTNLRLSQHMPTPKGPYIDAKVANRDSKP